jgi:hypothetical protein
MKLILVAFIFLLALTASTQSQQTAEDWFNKGVAICDQDKLGNTHCNSRFVNTDRFDPRAFGRAFSAQLKLRSWNVPSTRSHGETVYKDLRFISEQGGT